VEPASLQSSLRLQKDPQRGTLSFQLGEGFRLDLTHPFMAQMEIKTDLTQRFLRLSMQAEVPPNNFGFPWAQALEGTVRVVYQILLKHHLLSHFRIGISEPFAKGPFVFLRQRPI
jgi:hypothetical protein